MVSHRLESDVVGRDVGHGEVVLVEELRDGVIRRRKHREAQRRVIEQLREPGNLRSTGELENGPQSPATHLPHRSLIGSLTATRGA